MKELKEERVINR